MPLVKSFSRGLGPPTEEVKRQYFNHFLHNEVHSSCALDKTGICGKKLAWYSDKDGRLLLSYYSVTFQCLYDSKAILLTSFFIWIYFKAFTKAE